MFRPVPIRLYAALLALAAMLLLATVPTIGRTTARAGAEPAAADALGSDRQGPITGHLHHLQRAGDSAGTPAPLHTADDCVFCILLGSLAHPATRSGHLPVQHAHRTPVGRIQAAPAITRPLSTLGSRGPPGAAA